jgi:hypothetical protein
MLLLVLQTPQGSLRQRQLQMLHTVPRPQQQMLLAVPRLQQQMQQTV